MKRVLRVLSKEYEIIRWADDPGDGVRVHFSHRASLMDFLHACVREPANVEVLRRVLQTVTSLPEICRLPDQQVLELLAWRLLHGELRVVERPLVIYEAVSGEPDEKRRTAQQPDKIKTWVGIQMVGEDGKPVPGIRYEITLPNGQKKTGTTDSRGMARYDGIDPGSCVVTFPELDKDFWTKI